MSTDINPEIKKVCLSDNSLIFFAVFLCIPLTNEQNMLY